MRRCSPFYSKGTPGVTAAISPAANRLRGGPATRGAPSRTRSTAVPWQPQCPRASACLPRALSSGRTVADQSFGEQTAALAECCGQRIALHVVRQRDDFLLDTGDAAVAQIRDPCAAGLAQARERSDVGAQFHDVVETVAAAFERCAVVRRAEREQLTELSPPRMPDTVP